MRERSVALVTPSFAGDLDRCRLLCDSIDARVTGHAHHYILVADHDAGLFASLAGPRRTVLRESELLGEAFLVLRPPGARPLWLSTFAWPLRGWHAQQLRRMALPGIAAEDGFLYCDSDMAFARDFDVATLWRGERFRLYRNPGGIHDGLPGGGREHMGWTRHAHALLGLPAPDLPAHDYINNLVSWRRDSVAEMRERIEATTGRPWTRAITSSRAFSECQIYGAFADGIDDAGRHWIDETMLCRTRWGGNSMDERMLSDYLDTLDEGQVAVGIQSFTGTDPAALRRVLGL